MYCPDTLQRLNDEQVARYRAQVTKGELVTCDRCNGEGKIQGLVSNSSRMEFTPARCVLGIRLSMTLTRKSPVTTATNRLLTSWMPLILPMRSGKLRGLMV